MRDTRPARRQGRATARTFAATAMRLRCSSAALSCPCKSATARCSASVRPSAGGCHAAVMQGASTGTASPRGPVTHHKQKTLQILGAPSVVKRLLLEDAGSHNQYTVAVARVVGRGRLLRQRAHGRRQMRQPLLQSLPGLQQRGKTINVHAGTHQATVGLRARAAGAVHSRTRVHCVRAERRGNRRVPVSTAHGARCGRNSGECRPALGVSAATAAVCVAVCVARRRITDRLHRAAQQQLHRASDRHE